MADDPTTPDTLPEVDVNASRIQGDAVSDYATELGNIDPLLGRVEKSIQAEDEPQIQKYEAQAQAHMQQVEALDKQQADLAQRMAVAFKDQAPQIQKYIDQVPTRQGIYASTMHIAPMLSILSAIGGKMTRASGLQMLAAQTGIVQGMNQGNEQAYQDAVEKWKTGLANFQTQVKMQQQYYDMMLKAYGKRADAEEKAAAAAERMSGNIRTDEQKKLATAVQAQRANMQAAEQAERFKLMQENFELRRQQLALKGKPGELPEGWDQKTIDYYAERGARGDYSWRVGLSRSAGGAAIIAAIDRRAAELMDERGVSNAEAATIPATSKALTHALSERQSYLSAVQPAVANFNEEAQIVRDMLKPGVGGQSPLWNKYQQYARGQIAGDADVTALETALVGAGREHQRIITGPKSNAQMQQGAQDRADSLLNINQNAGQILRNLGVMEREGQNFVRANQEEVRSLRTQIRDLGAGPQLDQGVTPPAYTRPGALGPPRTPAAAPAAPAAAAPQRGAQQQLPADPNQWQPGVVYPAPPWDKKGGQIIMDENRRIHHIDPQTGSNLD